MKKILISGGPVFAYLDNVKIITNRFKGGLMANLANQIAKMPEKNNIIYLCSKDSKQPEPSCFIEVIHHNGLYDYRDKVLELAPKMDAIVLGAAVANLIPLNKIEGKFPSHNYSPGDIIPIDFTIAPRIIDMIKEVNPKVHLFGFKLLSNVSYYELIRAAYGVLLESKAVTVFANDTNDLMQKYAVTKERGVHPIHNNEVAQFILDRMNEKYYKTFTREVVSENEYLSKAEEELETIIKEHKNSFIKVEEGYVFGSAALKFGVDLNECWSFVTTARGKNEINDFSFVDTVDHNKKEVHCMTTKKATLNAPLFHNLFRTFSNIHHILHFHHQRDDLITEKYATPGTYEDSQREKIKPSFNIKGHGCILSFNKKGELLK